jgi:hypothetical protein
MAFKAIAPTPTAYKAIAPAPTAYKAFAPARKVYKAIAPARKVYKAIAPTPTAYKAIAPTATAYKAIALAPTSYKAFALASTSSKAFAPTPTAYKAIAPAPKVYKAIGLAPTAYKTIAPAPWFAAANALFSGVSQVSFPRTLQSMPRESGVRKRPKAKSGFLGVRANGNRWQAVISYDGRQHQLGTYDYKEQAAAAYDRAARQHKGHPLCRGSWKPVQQQGELQKKAATSQSLVTQELQKETATSQSAVTQELQKEAATSQSAVTQELQKEAATSQSAVTQELKHLRSEVERQNSVIDQLKADNDRLTRAEVERQNSIPAFAAASCAAASACIATVGAPPEAFAASFKDKLHKCRSYMEQVKMDIPVWQLTIDQLKADNDRLNRALKEKEGQEELEREPERPEPRARENEVLQQLGRTTNPERPHSNIEEDRAIGLGGLKAIICPPHVPPLVRYGSSLRQTIKEEEVERILDHSFQLTPQSTQSAAECPIPAANYHTSRRRRTRDTSSDRLVGSSKRHCSEWGSSATGS